ncbi:MAG: pyridoxal-phosphate dependent enzyme [Planctomycetota bacterium]
MAEPLSIPTLDDVRAATTRIAPFAHRTPVLTCSALDERAGRSLFFKCELFQKVGAFKFRGACNAIMKLNDETAARGIVTHSSGNHAQAVALASRLRGIPAYIVMPSNAPTAKRNAVLGYGAEVIDCEPTLDARETTAAAVQARTGATLIPPFDHADVIAGQGTMVLELLEQVDDLDAIVVPIGGGGMMSGICVASKGLRPDIRIIGAEPAGADDAYRSLQAGELIPQTGPDTIADGLLTSLAPITFAIIQQHVERILTVPDEAIVAEMRFVWERMKVVIEPSAAVGVAAALSETFMALDGFDRVGVILCGGNLDLDRLPWQA